MKITKLIATLLAAGLGLAACQQDEDYVLPGIMVNTQTLDFSATTEQTIDLVATRDWQILGKPDWIQKVDPDHGSGTSATQHVRVYADVNDGYDREGQIVFTIGLAKCTLALNQPGAKGEVPVGTGTLADPYTVTGVLRYIKTLAADTESPADVYVKGKISAITEAYSAQYGNATFEMQSDSGEKFIFFRGLYLGNKKWAEGNTPVKVGDEVVVCGKVVNYKGNTPETQQNKAYLYSLNGVTAATGGTAAVTYSKVTSITAGKKYVLVGVKGGKYYAATPLASNKTYGRLDGKETEVSNDKISGDMSSYEFTIASVTGGYTIAMPDGRLLGVDTEHDGTFQIGDNYDHTFTASVEGGLFKIVHKSTGKTIYHGGSTYTNFSCSATVPSDGTFLQLYLKDSN